MHDPFADAMLYARLACAALGAFAFVVVCSAGVRRVRLSAAAVLLAALAFVASALAVPPAGGPGPFSDWYRSLKSPVTGLSCCDEGDCRPAADLRMVRTGTDEDGLPVWNYEVLITPATHDDATEAAWVPVDRARILSRDNPTNRAVVCWRPYAGAMCLVLPGLT